MSKIESAEEFARRGWELDPSEFAEAVKSRDAAIRGEYAGMLDGDATLERVDLDSLFLKWKLGGFHAGVVVSDAELRMIREFIADRDSKADREITKLRAHITELEIRLAGAEPKPDPELLETARAALAAIINKNPPILAVKEQRERNLTQSRLSADAAWQYAQAFHAAAKGGGE